MRPLRKPFCHRPALSADRLRQFSQIINSINQLIKSVLIREINGKLIK